MAWTDNMVESLKKMWKQGMTTGEIGKKLGVSKNSVVGKVHRLKLDGRPSPIKKKEDIQSAAKNKPAVATTAAKPSLPKTKPAEIQKPAQTAAPKIVATAPSPKTAHPQATPTTLIKKPVIEKTAYQPKFPLKEETDLFAFSKPEKAKGEKLTVTDLDNHSCRWPLGDPKDEGFHFCGKKVRSGQTYCEEHSAIVYVKNNVKK